MIALLIAAAILNALMDTLKDHYGKMRWKPKNEKFWNPAISWRRKAFFGIYTLDAWHVAKSLMVMCLMGFAVFNHPDSKLPTLLGKEGMFVMYGLIWNVVFEIFYSLIFIKK